MADAVQLASALTSLIGATCVVVEYVKKLCESQKNARELYDRVRDLSNLLESIKPVIDDVERSSSKAIVNDQTYQLRKTVQGCLEGCNRSIDDIDLRLRSLADGKRGSLKARIAFVFGEREIKAHKTTIEGHIQSLQLSLITLNGLNDTVNHAMTHQFLKDVWQLLAYFIVTQRQHQQHPANMGLRTQDAVTTSSTLAIPGSGMLMLPSIEEPERNLNFYFSPVSWTSREPVPIARSSPQPVFSTNERIQEVVEEDISNESFSIGAVIDTPLAIAVKKNQPAIIQTLISSGQDITVVDAEDWTLFHHAVFERAGNALTVLLGFAKKHSPSLIDAQNKKQQTALMLCARRAEHRTSLELARTLIGHGADVNVEDGNGRTALHLVVELVANDNREAFAELLVESGAMFSPQCRRLPRCADDYEAVQNLAHHLRKTSSAVSAISSNEPFATSPDSATSPGAGDGRRRSRKFSMNSFKRRFSSDPNTGFVGRRSSKSLEDQS